MPSRVRAPGAQAFRKIIDVTAPAAIRDLIGIADYASAKGGVIAFTKNAADELAAFNIQVTGARMTDALAEYHSDRSGDSAVAHLRNLASPDAVAAAFLFFATADSDYVTGQVLAADGGATA